MAKEESNRKALADGQLGLDLYGLRDKLAARGVEYVTAGTEGTPMEPGDAGVRCMMMRGGTSKGAYFLAADLPADPAARDDLLLRIMGSPDARQIDGIGGAHPLTSKVAVVSPSARADADVDYLFLQLGVGEATVSDRQNCGNMLAGVGPFAVERGLVRGRAGADPHGELGQRGHRHVPRRGRRGRYAGDTAIAGVPGTAAAVVLEFAETEGSATGALLPTGTSPTSSTASTSPASTTACRWWWPAGDLAAPVTRPSPNSRRTPDSAQRVRALQLAAGQLMGLGDVSAASVPKISLVAAPADGGTICTRTFIPVRLHDVDRGARRGQRRDRAAARRRGRSVTWRAVKPGQARFDIEHPTGHLEVEVELDQPSQPPAVLRSGVVRTARKLFDGTVFPRSLLMSPQHHFGGGHAAAAARGRPPRAHRAADAGTGREPAVLRGHARPDRDRPRGRLGLPAHVG